jgi:hypothetical protein
MVYRQSRNHCKDGNVTYQVYATALGSATPVGNIWSNAVSVGANTTVQIYVGAGNKLTVTGSFTAAELGTASSAQSGVFNAFRNLIMRAQEFLIEKRAGKIGKRRQVNTWSQLNLETKAATIDFTN